MGMEGQQQQEGDPRVEPGNAGGKRVVMMRDDVMRTKKGGWRNPALQNLSSRTLT